ncbi:MAG TPA: protein kinase, partial [Anaerolineales bacterium]|nr:protein kinase [Anaerolineales bacterium]
MANWVGKRLGKVQIESLVARGGVAEIYVGTHTTLEHKVAVKILRNLSEDNSDALVRFQREARVIAKLRHPNIVQVHDFDTVDGDPYLVMEYIEGPSLSKYLNTLHQKNGRLELPQMIRLMNATASALQYAHKNGVVHRDIKPGNILLTSPSGPILADKTLPPDFEPVITDFGLVRFLDANRQTTTGQIAGTPAYMSPEQAHGEATDGRTDVYSLGIVLYELLAGHIPFDGETTMSILLKQVTEPPPAIPGLSFAIQNVLNRALAKDVNERYQTPLEFANAFSAAVIGNADPETIQTTTQVGRAALPPPPPKVEPPKPGPRWIRITVLGTMILAIALSGFFFVNGFPASPSQTATSTLASATDAATSAASTSAPSAAIPAGPIAILRFQNGSGIADQATLIARAMPAPPSGSQYGIWLIGADDRISLGNFLPDNTGKGEMTFTEPVGLNLLTLYDKVEITIEPKPDEKPEPSGLIAYSFTFPEEGLTHVRYLLSSFPTTPDENALIQGLYEDILNIDKLTKEMQTASEKGDKAGVLQKGEEALLLLAGAQSGDHKDWNGDGKTIDTGDPYGLLLNGNSFGYIQAVYAEADFTVNTSGATQYMIENGEVVKTCAQNLSLWTPELRSLLLTILTSTSDSEISGALNDLVALADQMLNGMDLDTNGKVDAISGECGAKSAYEYAYYMADMPILPVSISYQLTAVANATSSPIILAPTRTSVSSQNTP